MDHDDLRLRTAFLLSVADVFFGAIGVLVILIVLSADRSEQRIVERFDVRAICEGSDAGSLLLMPEDEDGAPLSADDWLETLPGDRFITRWAIRPNDADLACYLAARQIAENHNRKLEQRGATQAVLAVEYWVDLPQALVK